MKQLRSALKMKEDETESLGSLLRKEQDTVSVLHRMLQQFEEQKQAMASERMEYMRAQRKLSELKHLEALILGESNVCYM